MNNIDKKLKYFFSNDTEETLKEKQYIHNNIEKTLNSITIEKTDFKTNIFKTLGATLLSICIISTTVFAGFNIINNVFNLKYVNDTGIQNAINNNYIQNFNMEYISTDMLDFKIDYFLMDDIDLITVFNFKLKENIEYYQGISLGNLKIVDEENRQIFLDTEGEEHYKNYALLHAGWHLVEKYDNIMRQSLFLVSNDFPKSNQLYITFDSITLYKVENGIPETKTYDGNWCIYIDISEKLKNRKTINYASEDANISNIKTTNSGLTLDIKMNDYTRDLKIVDENNKEYNVVHIIGKKDREKSKYIDNEYVITFDMTAYNATDTIYLQIKNNKIKLTKTSP